MRHALFFAAFASSAIALSHAAFADPPGFRQGYRVVPFNNPGEARPHVWIRGFRGTEQPYQSTVTGTYAPSGIAAAYQLDELYSWGATGLATTIAIVDAYDSPNALADLNAFSSNFGLPAMNQPNARCSGQSPTFTKVSQTGSQTSLPARNSGWEVEINLDTQWAHAIAPCANIVLVEASSSSIANLMAAVKTAGSMANYVTMSWGGGESRSQTSYDSQFSASRVTYLASSGDTGGIVEWPSSSPHVIAVGGTDLVLNANLTVQSETAWSGTGGGCSTVEPAIAPQSGVVPSSCQHRATPDVSIAGGPTSAVYVYISDQGGWFEVYGTSLSVQLWGGVLALTGPSDGNMLTYLYEGASGLPYSSLYQSDYRDIVSGTAGSFSAAPGWDFTTGLGSPLTASLLPFLVRAQE